MAIFIVTFCFIALVVAAMAIGVIFKDQPIKGSCGGMSAIGIDTACDICGGDTGKCDQENQATSALAETDLAYEVIQK